MGGRRNAGVVLAVVAALGAGCGSPAVDGGGPPGGGPEVYPAWTSCSAAIGEPTPRPSGTPDLLGPGREDTGAGLPRLGDDFAPVAVVVCARGVERRPDGGQDMVATEQRAEDVADLVAALRLPDEPRGDGACTMDLVTTPWLALLDADGRWVRPGVPVDACAKPRIEVRDALGALKLTRVSGRTVGEVESAEAAAAGCSQSWADMVWVIGTDPGGGRGEIGALYDGPGPVRLCVHRVPASEQRSGKPAGTFEDGREVPADDWATIKREVGTAPAAAPCTTPANRFAVLLAEPGAQLYVELDGCRRVLAGSSLRQATPELLGKVTVR